MTLNTIVTIVIIVATLAIILLGCYFYLRDKSLNDIRADVYQKFLEAEHDPRFTNKPKKRMVWVLQQARSLLPGWTQILVTDKFLEKIVEGWFRAIKDLLDDGKYNKSVKKEVEE